MSGVVGALGMIPRPVVEGGGRYSELCWSRVLEVCRHARLMLMVDVNGVVGRDGVVLCA